MVSPVTGLTDEEIAALESQHSSGLTDEELAALEQSATTPPVKQISTKQAPKKPLDTSPVSGFEKMLASAPNWMLAGNRPMRAIAQGAADPSVGLAQLASKAVGVDGVSQAIANKEAEYQAQRGDTGMDWGRLAGNLISPTNVLPAAALPKATTLMGRVGQGAGLGALMGASTPVENEDDYWNQKVKDVGVGAALGSVIPLVTKGVSKVLSPQTDPRVRALQEEGIRTTPGQTLGGVAKSLEDKITSLPIVGDAIQAARRGGIEDVNRAVYNRILKPIGETLDDTSKVGHEALKNIHEKLNKAYDDTLKNISLKSNTVFDTRELPPSVQNYVSEWGPSVTREAPQIPADSYLSRLAELRDAVSHMPKEYVAEFDDVLKKEITSRATKQGNMSGESLNEATKGLLNQANNLKNSNDLWQKKLADAYKQANSILLDSAEKQNPEYGEKLRNLREAWHNYAIARDAAAMEGASANGIFTPSQLMAQVRANEKRLLGRAAGNARISEGRAFMQDLAANAKEVLPSKYPDSGTIGRAALAAGTIGGGLLHPPTLVGLGAASLPYLPGGRWIANKTLTARPEIARKAAGALDQVSPYLSIPVVSSVMQPAKD